LPNSAKRKPWREGHWNYLISSVKKAPDCGPSIKSSANSTTTQQKELDLNHKRHGRLRTPYVLLLPLLPCLRIRYTKKEFKTKARPLRIMIGRSSIPFP